MKKSIPSFLLGVALTLSVVVFTSNSMPLVPTLPTPTPQIIYRDVIKEVEKLTDLETVAKNCKNSAVMIYAYLPNGTTSQGSGWVYKGYVISAKHVVDGSTKIEVFVDDQKNGFYGTVHYIDPKLDLVILKATTGQKTVTLGDSDKLIEGEKLVSITSPQGAMNVIEECTFAGKLETETQSSLNISDTSITGGSSGGAIFNYDSEIIGMATNGENNVTEAIPINRMKSVLSNIK